MRVDGFDLHTFAARSFGAYWDGQTFDVIRCFSNAVAADARCFRFHHDQHVSKDATGRIIVAFEASGLTEMVWHLFTWGPNVEILAPEALRIRYRACLAEAKAALDAAAS